MLKSMCGRFRVARVKEILEEAFEAEDALSDLELIPRYNVAPGQDIATVRQNSGGERWLSATRWGLIPSWATAPSSGFKMINVPSETVPARPAFRDALRLRRCLIPSDGFYEWKREGKQKLPFSLTMIDNSVFAFVGIWDRWKSSQGQVIESCSI